jgi:hypothetical protein
MSDDNGSPVGEVPSVALPADAPESFDSPNAAAAYLTSLREKPDKEQPAESANEATAEPELSVEDNAAPVEATGEDEEAAPVEEPLRELPRSWTKDRNDVWAKLDPATQDILLEQDRKASAEVRRLQNEAADERKALTAQREAAEKAKQDYLNKVPTLEDIQRFVQQGPFADIKTQDDADALAQNDPLRYLQWDSYQKRLAGAAVQAQQAQALKAQESQNKRAAYEAEQNKLLVELIPEMADAKKGNELRERAVAMLTNDFGLKNDQLARWMQDDVGHEILSNASIQKLIADGLKLRDIQNATKAVAAKPLPPVQRPGISKPAGSSVSEREQVLTRQLNETGDLRIAQELYALQSSRRKAS